MEYYINIILKLLLSVVLGGFIGFERENKNRPAGLRTNVLVCLGAALVQIVSLDIFTQYKGLTNLDPARLGAQVISGIGFLGAGTIIHEGSSVKGLTTAASLWVVACIGLAIGNGSYLPGILTAVFTYFTLHMLKVMEDRVSSKNPYFNVEIQLYNKPGEVDKISQVLGDKSVNIRNIKLKEHKGGKLNLYMSLKVPVGIRKDEVINTLMKEKSIYSIEEL